MFGRQLSVTIQFPALDALIAYLREHDDFENKINAATVQVQELTAALKKSGVTLQSEVNKEGK